MAAAPETSPLVPLRRGALAVVMGAAIALVFIEAAWLTALASAALVLFLGLGWRQFSVGTWVPVCLSLAVLAAALWQGVAAQVYLDAAGRMLFLAALIAVLGTLRSAAALAPEVAQAGAYVTGQPAARRYVALTMGGHLFGVLINFGGLALLLDLAMGSMRGRATAELAPEIREVRLKRMTVAVIRGFGLIALWSPLGFAVNAVLITLPGISYMQFGPLGFAMSFVFAAIGWAFDRADGRRFRRLNLPRPAPPPGAGRGAVLLVGHVVALGGTVFGLHEVAPLSFQEALIVTVPSYAVLWAAAGGRGGAGVARAARATWTRLSSVAGEVGIFAAAGFLPVLLLALVPLDPLRAVVAGLGLGAVPLALGLTGGVVVSALLGVNPIVSASLLGAVATELDVPGLSDTAIALAITGGWSGVIGLSPFITTITFASGIVGRPVGVIGPLWNGPYCLTILAVWAAMLAALMLSGLI